MLSVDKLNVVYAYCCRFIDTVCLYSECRYAECVWVCVCVGVGEMCVCVGVCVCV